MTQLEKAEIVFQARPVSLLIKILGLKDADKVTLSKTLNKYKAFRYKHYDGGFRTSVVYLHEGVYYCNLHKAPGQMPKEKK
ncbi:hypothetical protein FRZ67_10935 [Panacibacter ginsenosidivorans]|uniref:Uncharacterized protein n=1 Tax=Panacibacter ginsenosidivorans TaxID=1813871 RepID=A0A5B8V9G8_9BACT|nr:hypothetical protein [Panacibacter ginsenosidivorans]QEC67785.1 hypothetical protein FRZ67_10935 [Panacibacter ginsenosidivorans]